MCAAQSFSLAPWGGVSPPVGMGTWRRMAMRLPAMLLAAAMLVSGAAGENKTDPNKTPSFAYPFQNDTVNIYYKMDTVMVTYTSFYDTAILWTFCQPGKGIPIYHQRAPGFTASVPILLNFTSATLCWFNVRTGEDGIDSMNSQSFHVIGEERKTGRMVFGPDTEQPAAVPIPSAPSSSTSSLVLAPAPASPPPSSSTTVVLPAKGTDESSSSSDSGNDGSGGSPPNSSPTATDTTATDNTSSSSGGGNGEELGGGGGEKSGAGGREESGGLGSKVTAGIGVGATIGVFAIAGGVFMLWRRRRRQQRSQERAAAASTSAAGREMAGAGDNGWSQPSFDGYYGELSSAGKSAGSSAGPGWHFADWTAAQKWELDAQRGAVEAPEGAHRHEMPA